MCGITGIFDFSNKSKNLKEDILKMNLRLSHRGPDDSGFWENQAGDLCLGQTRLSILDLSSAGHQPMKDAQGSVVSYNGEVYNFKILNNQYLKNESFFSGSDTETLLKLYQKFGLDMLPKLNGMFAFALWDPKKEELILSRDRSGKKPLYYTISENKFVFASELKAILELPWVKKEMDDKVLYDFLTYKSVPPPNTMFKNIFKFKQGHYMVLNKNGIKEYKEFHQLRKVNLDYSSEKDLEDMIFNKLDESVKLRMISDVPVGAFLSGGVDSSAIVALMRKNTANEIKTFTVGFEGQPNYNELDYAEKISKSYDTNHHVKMVTPDDLLDFIPKIAEIYDEPQADTTAIPIYFISQLANKENIKVVLNGDGPDELFSGYSNYRKYINLNEKYNRLKKVPKFVRSLSKNLIGISNQQSIIYEMVTRLNNNQDLYWPGASGLKESLKSKILSNAFKEKVKGHSSYNYVQKLKNEYDEFLSGAEYDYVNWLCFSGYKHAITEIFLFRADRLGMSNSIEARSPFLNHEMVELALSIPGELKIKNGIDKQILKKSLERILPDEILYRKKMGFNLPINEWAQETICAHVEKNIKKFNSNYNIFNEEMILNQVSQAKRGNKSQVNSLWATFFLMNWFEKWV